MTTLEKIKNFSKTFMYEEFDINSTSFSELKKYFIESFKNNDQKNFTKQDLEIIFYISHTIGNKPFVTQEEIYNLIFDRFGKNISIEKLLELNNEIRKSELCQNLIINFSIGSKYWKNTIIPINESGSIINTLEKNPVHPYRIGIYPGLSCMFECVFCGRNYSAKYDRSLLDEGIDKYITLINTSPKDDKFKFYISGGLEPLTNPKLNTIIQELKKMDLKYPFILMVKC